MDLFGEREPWNQEKDDFTLRIMERHDKFCYFPPAIAYPLAAAATGALVGTGVQAARGEDLGEGALLGAQVGGGLGGAYGGTAGSLLAGQAVSTGVGLTGEALTTTPEGGSIPQGTPSGGAAPGGAGLTPAQISAFGSEPHQGLAPWFRMHQRGERTPGMAEVSNEQMSMMMRYPGLFMR